MKRTVLPERFQQLLTDIPYVTIASTCPDGSPWNTPVVGYFDDNLNLYWVSWMLARHSRNIANNNSVFAVIYDSGWPLGTGEALYLQMCARKLVRRSEIDQAKLVYLDRYGEVDCPGVFAGVCPRRIYKAEPLRIWSNTDGTRGKHFVDVRHPIFEKT